MESDQNIISRQEINYIHSPHKSHRYKILGKLRLTRVDKTIVKQLLKYTK